MAEPNQLLARIEALETQVAFQDQTIEDLNKAITKQWEEFDRLHREIGKLSAELQQIDAGDASDPADERPPHY